MSYRFISFASTPLMSHVKYIWIDQRKDLYYITNDQLDIIHEKTQDDSYMLIQQPKKPTRYSKYKNTLKHIIKQLSSNDLNNGFLYINGDIWQFTK